MSIYRFKGNESDIEVYSENQVTALKKVKKDSIVKFQAELPKTYIRLMERTIGKHSNNAELLREFLKQISKI